jgi:phosphodiesterase/alkaline phosphatase D-like protein
MAWKRLFQAARTKPARRLARRVRLGVETLESRTLLTASPYVVPVNPAVTTQALLTVGDSVGGYRMVGIPDGLGAFDNGDGTFTLLMNHELGNTSGVPRAHGGTGAFVSEWVIDKSTLQVLSGQDLDQTVILNGSTSLNFNRFCSADLPAPTAFFFDPTPGSPNSGDEVGTTDRIYMNGEEVAGGRAFGHVVTGTFAHTSYELPLLGRFAHENVVASPFAQGITLVAGLDDTSPLGKVFFYVGSKTNSGTPVDRAGLTNGTNFAIQVGSLTGETAGSGLAASGALVTSGHFTLANPATGGTGFLRPEDGAWDPLHPNDFYFVTTHQFDQVQDGVGTTVGRSRLWRLRFDDLTNPAAGGTIEMLLDGSEGGNMYDNITVDTTGHIILQEDVGNQAHIGKVWTYDIANDRIFQLARHDPARFGDVGVPATAPYNQDEESSGVIDVSSILGPGSYLLDVQAHYPINSANPNGFSNPNELVEGGQLLLMKITPTVSFLGVGAGDATSTDAILWTRAQDVSSSAGVALMAQVSNDPTFATGLATFAGVTDPSHDFTIHVDATGLQPATRYYYRFVASDNTFSPVGTFVTAPDATANVPVSLGFTGDADGLMRPYDATNSANFTAPTVSGVGSQNFDYFVWLGDTIYETKSGDGTPNSSPAVNNTPNVTEYWRKYREQFLPVSTGAYAGLTNFFDSTGHYTLLDNHELGNRQFINGGAPANAPFNTTDPQFDVNTTGTYMHNTAGFQTLEQAYTDYQPIRVDTVSAPNDPRSDGTQKLYFAQQWGANNIFFNVDDRTNRDIRLRNASGDDTGGRADNPNRTMLGATELQWLEQSLLSAQQQGITWKIVSTSSPIDQIGAIGSGSDGGKSWIGGYRAERNALLKFIADNHIDHVVFLSTDDHQLRVNELGYFTQFTTNSLGYPAPVQSSYTRVPGAISIVAGPIGATGPDTVTDHSFANIKALADALVAQETAAGVDPIGLDAAFPGLKNVSREGDPNAGTNPTGFDFYSPDTFNYATLNVSADGSTLTVGVKGINSYAVNAFPQPGAANAVRDILSFQVGLEHVNVAVAPATATAGGTTTLTATLTDAENNAPLAGRTLVFSLNGQVVGTATTNANGTASLPDVSVAGLLPGHFDDAVTVHFAGDAADLPGDGSASLDVFPARDVTDLVRVRKNGPVMGPQERTNTADLTITNPMQTGGAHSTTSPTLTGLFAVQLYNLPSGVTLDLATMFVNGITYHLTITHNAAGAPIINVPASVATSLSAGQSLPKMALLFKNPLKKHFDFDTQVFLDPLA